MQARRVDRVRAADSSAATFGGAVESWLALRREEWSEVHYATARRALERDTLPALGQLPIAEITSAMIAAVIEPIAKRGAVETARRDTLEHQPRVSAREHARPGHDQSGRRPRRDSTAPPEAIASTGAARAPRAARRVTAR